MAADIEAAIFDMRSESKRIQLMRFFKTAPGEYGFGDQFLGVTAPQVRLVVKEAKHHVGLDQVHLLIQSPYHEVRLCGFLLLVEMMLDARPKKRIDSGAQAIRRAEIARFYLDHARQANNWDLVDMSSPKILGSYLVYPNADGQMPSLQILHDLAASSNLWEQRIAMVTNWMLIRHDILQPTIDIALKLLNHPHDLIHKAVGWMLRELGKRQPDMLHHFLNQHIADLHRTTLRYAIELLPEHQRQAYLHM